MIFADTAYFLALLNPHVEWHRTALRLSGELEEPLLTTTWILVELGDALARTRQRIWFQEFLFDVTATSEIKVTPPIADDFDRGLLLYSSRRDKEWSLTDCISFEVMREHRIESALTPDRHFIQAGFKALFRD